MSREVKTIASNFSSIQGLAVDDVRGVVYVADTKGHAIKAVVMATGSTSILSGGAQGFVDGPCSTARFSSPWGLAYDDRALYISEYEGHRVRRILFYANQSAPVFKAASVGNTMTFTCASGVFLNVSYAAFGTPELNPLMGEYAKKVATGNCGSGTNYIAANVAVKNACIGKSFCSLNVTNNLFGLADPCVGILKWLVVGLSGCKDPVEQCVVSSVAGSGVSGGTDSWGVAASFSFPKSIAIKRTPDATASSSSLWIADNGRLRSLLPAGYVVTAVTGINGASSVTFALWVHAYRPFSPQFQLFIQPLNHSLNSPPPFFYTAPIFMRQAIFLTFYTN
jgi:hypothetical protein